MVHAGGRGADLLNQWDIVLHPLQLHCRGGSMGGMKQHSPSTVIVHRQDVNATLNRISLHLTTSGMLQMALGTNKSVNGHTVLFYIYPKQQVPHLSTKTNVQPPPGRSNGTSASIPSPHTGYQYPHHTQAISTLTTHRLSVSSPHTGYQYPHHTQAICRGGERRQN